MIDFDPGVELHATETPRDGSPSPIEHVRPCHAERHINPKIQGFREFSFLVVLACT